MIWLWQVNFLNYHFQAKVDRFPNSKKYTAQDVEHKSDVITKRPMAAFDRNSSPKVAMMNKPSLPMY